VASRARIAQATSSVGVLDGELEVPAHLGLVGVPAVPAQFVPRARRVRRGTGQSSSRSPSAASVHQAPNRPTPPRAAGRGRRRSLRPTPARRAPSPGRARPLGRGGARAHRAPRRRRRRRTRRRPGRSNRSATARRVGARRGRRRRRASRSAPGRRRPSRRGARPRELGACVGVGGEGIVGLPRLQPAGGRAPAGRSGASIRSPRSTRSWATNAARGPEIEHRAQFVPGVVLGGHLGERPDRETSRQPVGLVEHRSDELRRRQQREAVLGERRGRPQLAAGRRPHGATGRVHAAGPPSRGRCSGRRSSVPGRRGRRRGRGRRGGRPRGVARSRRMGISSHVQTSGQG
jgi:hypothetical protein